MSDDEMQLMREHLAQLDDDAFRREFSTEAFLAARNRNRMISFDDEDERREVLLDEMAWESIKRQRR